MPTVDSAQLPLFQIVVFPQVPFEDKETLCVVYVIFWDGNVERYVTKWGAFEDLEKVLKNAG